MRMRIALSFALALLPRLASADAWILAPGDYDAELLAARYSADSFLDSEGTRFPTPFGGRLEERAMGMAVQLGWKEWLTFGVSAPVLSRTLQYTEVGFQRTETGFGDLTAGFRAALKQGRSAAAVSGALIAPMGYQTTVLPPYLGTGRHRAEGRLHLGTGFPGLQAFVDVSGGYRHWFQDLAPQIVASAEAGVWLGPSVLLLGHYDGAVAAGEGDTPASEYDEHLVGPEVRYRVDDRLDVLAGSNHTASGKQVLHVDQIYVGMAFRMTKLDRLQGVRGSKQRP